MPAQEHDVEEDKRAFVIKRNLSNAATHVLTVRVPDWLLEQACLTHPRNWSTVQPCLDGSMAPWRAGPAMELSEDLSTGTAPAPSHSIQLLICSVIIIARLSCQEARCVYRQDTCEGCRNPAAC